MGKVRFNYRRVGEYCCCCFQRPCKVDHSGDYWPDADYRALEAEVLQEQGFKEQAYAANEALQTKLAALVGEVKAVADSLFPGPLYGRLKTAIDAAEGKP